jgi:PLD-like domain
MAARMTDQLLKLSGTDLRGIATALRSGRLVAPFSGLSLQRLVPAGMATDLAGELQGFVEQGFTPTQIASTIELLLADRLRRLSPEETIDLVTSGPEGGAAANRDTRVVVRELFAGAEHSVLVAGYAVYQGHRVFKALADRMQERINLSVRLFLDVPRPTGDTSIPGDIVRRFGEHFRRHDWPQDHRLPEVFYLPLSLADSGAKKSSLHAKCVVVDRRTVFVGSANFTEAAQERNIEIGLRVHSPWLADRITQHFDSMVAERLLLPVYR